MHLDCHLNLFTLIQILFHQCHHILKYVLLNSQIKNQSGQFSFLNQRANIFDIENMDVHNSPTIQLNHYQKLEPSPTISQQFLKKRSTILEDDCHHYETIKKKIHTNEENDSTYLAETVKKHISSFEEEKSSDKRLILEKPFYTNAISAIPLRQKYAQLIPDFQADECSLQHKMLLRIQSRLDEHLLYLKNHRGKKKGQFFQNLRKNLIQSSQIIMDLRQLKQILFIDSSLYICNWEQVKNNLYDFLLDLTSTDLTIRKIEFKKKLLSYIQQKKGFNKVKNAVIIPMITFDFQLKTQVLFREKKKQILEPQQEEAKQDRIGVLENFFNKNFNIKQCLGKGIEEKEKRIKQNLAKNQRKYGREEVLKVIDEVFLVYTSKGISNMFRVTLIESISKKLLITDSVVHEIIELLLNNESYFMKRIENSKGIIVQIDLKKYKTCRENIKEMNFNE